MVFCRFFNVGFGGQTIEHGEAVRGVERHAWSEVDKPLQVRPVRSRIHVVEKRNVRPAVC
jgi:hypothetical protein